mmetsp:Transcript_29889/g.67627  ORF Transcript_29889/g.67627 Transcript_29889/m.67627 type:complete len:235 (-) Transcript_29889:1275-1979(-)
MFAIFVVAASKRTGRGPSASSASVQSSSSLIASSCSCSWFLLRVINLERKDCASLSSDRRKCFCISFPVPSLSSSVLMGGASKCKTSSSMLRKTSLCCLPSPGGFRHFPCKTLSRERSCRCMGVDWLILLFDVWSYASDMMVVKTVRRMRTHMLVYSNARMPPKTGLSLSTSSKLTPTSKLLKAVVKESKMFLYSAATDPKETWNAVANPKSRIASKKLMESMLYLHKANVLEM